MALTAAQYDRCLPERPKRDCRVCGKAFSWSNKFRWKCSTECRIEAARRATESWGQRHPEKLIERERKKSETIKKKIESVGGWIRPCSACGKSFIAPTRNRMLCSDVCRRAAYVRARASMYGITVAELDAVRVSQGGVCAICRTSGGKKGLCVDHDHKTGSFRGLLCGSCNLAIGYLKEDASVMRSAIEYVTKVRAIRSSGGA